MILCACCGMYQQTEMSILCVDCRDDPISFEDLRFIVALNKREEQAMKIAVSVLVALNRSTEIVALKSKNGALMTKEEYEERIIRHFKSGLVTDEEWQLLAKIMRDASVGAEIASDFVDEGMDKLDQHILTTEEFSKLHEAEINPKP